MKTATIERLFRFCIFAALLAPAVFVPWLAHPFIFGKTAYFMCAVAGAAVFFVPLLYRGAAAPAVPFFLKLFVAYYAVLLLAAAFGEDPARSFFGEAVRMTGLVTHFFLLAFLFMLAGGIRNATQWRRIFITTGSVGLLVAALTTLEAISPFLRRLFGNDDPSRLAGPIGNSIFLGMYLALVTGVLAWLAAESRTTAARIGWGAGAFFAAFVAATTGSRGAAAGIVVGVLVGLVTLAAVARTRRARRFAVVALLLVLALGALAYGVGQTSFGNSRLALKRLVRISAQDFGPRLINWQIAWQGIREHPFLGSGPENYLYVFDRHYRPELLRYGIVESTSDKPHNGLIEIAVAGGALALGLFLLFWGWVCGALIRAARRGSIQPALASVGVGMVAAYLISNFFAFDTPVVQIVLMTFLAYVAHRLAPSPEKAAATPTALYGATASVVAAGLAALFYLVVVRPLPSFAASQRASEAAHRNPFVWEDAFRRIAESRHVYAGELVREHARVFILWENRGTMPDKFASAVLPLVSEALDAAIEKEPANFYMRYERGQIALIAGDHAVAEAAFRRAAELSPRRQTVAYMQAKVLLLTGRGAEATALLKSIVDADPRIGQSHWFYGLALMQTGEREAGIAALEAARVAGRALDAREKLYLIDLYAADRAYEKIAALYEELAAAEPQSAVWHARLAATYAAQGKIELAIIEARRAAELDPSYADERDAFINQLPKE